MTKDEAISTERALDLALEALERMKGYCNVFLHRRDERNPHEQVCEAITAIKQARSAPVPEPVAWVDVKDTNHGPYAFHGKELLPVGKHDLYTTPPAQPAPDLSKLKPENQQQMREWIADGSFAQRAIDTMFEFSKEITALKAAPVPEPVAWMFEDDEGDKHKTFRQTPPSPEDVAYIAKWNRPAWVPLYTTPPGGRQSEDCLTAAQLQWVGLTDEERKEIWKGCDPTHAGYVTALVEAKLKEKNT
jgi:hypothetical protein